MKLFLITAAFLTLASLSSAQAQDISYYSKDGLLLSQRDSAYYYRKIEPDTIAGLFKINEFFIATGKPKFTGHTTKPNEAWLQGGCIAYFPNGNKMRVAQYNKGKETGDVTLYYPNGSIYSVIEYVDNKAGVTPDEFAEKAYIVKANYDQSGNQLVSLGNGSYVGYDNEFSYVSEEGTLKDGRRDGNWKAHTNDGDTQLQEVYKYGQLLTGTAIFKDGSISTYKGSRTTTPYFKGGIEEFYKFLGQTIVYPVTDRKKGTEGRVIATFVVARDGQLQNIEIIRSASPTIDAEAIRALQLSPKWEPGTRFSKKVRVQYTVPIVFTFR